MAPVPKAFEFENVDEESPLLLVEGVPKSYCRDVVSKDTVKSTSPSDDEPDEDEMSTEVCSLDTQEMEANFYCHSSTRPSSPLRVLWDAYMDALERKPLLVKSITAFILMGMADALAQFVEHLRAINPEVFNFWRMLRFGVFGLVGAPWTHYYYDWLDRVLPPTPEPWTWTTAIKVFIDQFIQAPALLALIISGMAVMQGQGPLRIWGDLQRQYIPTLLANWKLWIPATIVNIAFIKPILRVLYDNLVFFVWTIFLSIMLNAPAPAT